MAGLNTRRVSFLWGMVTGEFYTYRNWDRDNESTLLADQARKARPEYDDGGLYGILGDVLSYTVDLGFVWEADTPDHIRALESFWLLHTQGKPPGETFPLYATAVSNVVLFGESATPLTTEEMLAYSARKPADVDLKQWLDALPKTEPVIGWQRAMLMAFERWTPKAQRVVDADTDPLPESSTSNGKNDLSAESPPSASATAKFTV